MKGCLQLSWLPAAAAAAAPPQGPEKKEKLFNTCLNKKYQISVNRLLSGRSEIEFKAFDVKNENA